MKCTALIFSATLMVATSAFAQDPPAQSGPGNKAVNSSGQNNSNAPVAGRNSFTEGQAKSKIEEAGFTNVSGLLQFLDFTTITLMPRGLSRASKTPVSHTLISVSSPIIRTVGTTAARHWTATATALMIVLRVPARVQGSEQASVVRRASWQVLAC
jgi:hypothetical protein